MKRDILLGHLTLRLASGARGPLPDLAVPFLHCVEARADGMTWFVRNADVIMHRPHTVAKFNEAAQAPLGYQALLELLARVDSLNEITVFVPRPGIDLDLEEQLIRRDFTPFRICIDLRDSTEWTFFSDSPEELACAAALIKLGNFPGSTDDSA